MKKIFTLLILFVSVLILSSCSSSLNKYSKNFYCFGTEIEISIYARKEKDADKALDECGTILSDYNKLTDRYTDYRNTYGVYYINSHAGELIKIDEKLFDLLKFAVDNSNILLNDDGNPYFTIGIGKVSDIYHDLFENHNMESLSSSDVTINKDIDTDTDASLIELDAKNKTIKIPVNMSLDLGGIAKGYTVDRLKEYLDDNDIKYSINAGSSSITTSYGNPSREDNSYRVGLKKPVIGETNEPFGVFTLDLYKTASTSAFYQKYVIIDGITYSHILDPYTYSPVDTDILSITVITEGINNGAMGDIISTVLYMAGYKKALSYIENTDGIEGVIYRNDGTVYVSAGIKGTFTYY